MAASPGALLVADSFRVRANPRTGAAEVRGLELHLGRFTRSAAAAAAGRGAAAAGSAATADRFLADALPRIAEFGAGFPRLELRRAPSGDPEFGLSLRPLPPLRDAIELRTAPPIRLERARYKGPNLERLTALNRELGAEALLVDGDGAVLEGATTALLWWSGGALCAVASQERVPSVCEALVREIAASLDVEVRAGVIGTAALARHEAWAVNALHGIRPVTRVDGVVAPRPDERRLLRFREALDRTWRPVAG